MPNYGDQRVSRIGLVVTVLLHVLLVLFYLFRSVEEKPPVAPGGVDITYIKPLQGKPKRVEAAAPAVPVKPKVAKQEKIVKSRKAEVVKMARLPDTITLPEEKPVEREVPEPPKPKSEPVAPAEDMSARIAARQAARAQERAQNGEETEEDRGNRLARANIAAANGKSREKEGEPIGVTANTVSFNSAYLEFRGWDEVKKRRVLERVDVDLGQHRDIEMACVKKMVQLLRQGGASERKWTSSRLNKELTLSVRPEDTQQLESFLYLELFPRYRRAGQG